MEVNHTPRFVKLINRYAHLVNAQQRNIPRDVNIHFVNAVVKTPAGSI